MTKPLSDAEEAATEQEEEPKLYPCHKCGKLRTKSEGGTVFTLCDKCWDESHNDPNDFIDAKAREQVERGVDTTNAVKAVVDLQRQLADMKVFAHRQKEHLEGLIEAARLEGAREGWEAARTTEIYNLHDPRGERIEHEKNYPPMMQTIGFAAGQRNKYETFESWQLQRKEARNGK